MDLSQATGAVETIDVAGEEHLVRPLTMKEWGAVTAWLKRQAPSPVTRAGRAIDQAAADGEPLSFATQEAMLNHAQRSALNWPPRLGSEAWFDALDRTEGGQARLVFEVLSKTETVTLEQVEAPVKRFDVGDFNELLRVALYGAAAAPKSRSGRRGRVEDDGADDWAPLLYTFADRFGISPAQFGDLTYPQVIALITKGDPDKLHKELWAAKKILADHKAGRLTWREGGDVPPTFLTPEVHHR